MVMPRMSRANTITIIDRWINAAHRAGDKRASHFWIVRDVACGLRAAPERIDAAIDALRTCRASTERDTLIKLLEERKGKTWNQPSLEL